MRKYTTEFVGTFFLVLTICNAVLSKAALAPIAIGLALAALVFAGGHVSGAHYNPAVTTAVFLRGGLPGRDVGPYMAAQTTGAIAAAGLSRWLIGVTPGPALSATGRALVAAFVAELLVTFLLCYVVLNVATSRSHPNNSFYGLAIGGTVLAGAITVGGISGGVFNPAVAVGVSVAGLVSWSMLWVYLVANIAAGALAAGVFRMLNPAEHEKPDPATAYEQMQQLDELGQAAATERATAHTTRDQSRARA
jgi:aquaporin Z